MNSNSKSRKKVLVFIDWYLPGYKAGGPIPSVANIIDRLKNEFDFAIITSDTDDSETEPYRGIKSNTWTTAPDGTRTYYFSKEGRKFGILKKVVFNEQADFIYLNSLFSVFFTFYPLIIRKLFLPSRKTILAPRGMLGKGALQIKSGKKKTFLRLAKLMGLYKNLTWHASTDLEAVEIALHFGKHQRVLVATDLTNMKATPSFDKSKETGKARFVFLSRISSKKNLLVTIESLSKLPDNFNVVFDIYGPVDDVAFWEICRNAISKTPAHVKINYKGAVSNNEIRDLLKSYHFSLLYTHHENYGHSIIESMLAGCVPVISDQTPWRNLETEKAGWDISINDENAFIDILKTCCQMDQLTYSQWSKGSYNFALQVVNNPQLIEDNRQLFT